MQIKLMGTKLLQLECFNVVALHDETTNCLKCCTFLDDWKEGSIVLVHSKNSKQLTNYTLVSYAVLWWLLVITTAQHYSTKPEFRSCAGLLWHGVLLPVLFCSVLSIRPSVRPSFLTVFSGLAYYFFLTICMKSGFNKRLKLTEPYCEKNSDCS